MSKRVFFYSDCGPEIGGGHVMRSLALAEALAERGAACAFAATPMAAGILERYGAGAVQAAPSGADLASVREAAARWGGDWLCLDHYRLSREDEAALRGGARRLAVIDDLAQRPRDADLVLDPSYGRTEADYRPLLPPGAAILTGPAYALLRPQFAEAREAALARRGGGPVRRGLVSMGLTDVDGITERVVRALLPIIGLVNLDVVVGGAAPSLRPLRAMSLHDPRVRLHIDARDMAALIARADLAVGAGGSSTWERACLGLPSITLVLADNQRSLAQALAHDGASRAVEAEALETALADAWLGLAENPVSRMRMAAQGAALCDGLGAARAADALLAL